MEQPMPRHARILIVEDEPIIAMDVEAALHAAGAEISGVAATLDEALALVEAADLAGAILDLRLQGHSVRKVVDRLSERAIPFVFYTGLDDAPTARQWPAVPIVGKPALPADAVKLLLDMI
jgi:CheY-like chemotaxis protein